MSVLQFPDRINPHEGYHRIQNAQAERPKPQSVEEVANRFRKAFRFAVALHACKINSARIRRGLTETQWGMIAAGFREDGPPHERTWPIIVEFLEGMERADENPDYAYIAALPEFDTETGGKDGVEFNVPTLTLRADNGIKEIAEAARKYEEATR